MKRRAQRLALIFLAFVCVLLAVPVGLTWRVVRQERLNRALIAAVKANDDRAVVSLLQDGADANCRDEPLRNANLWETLMEAFRGRMSQPSHGHTALILALMHGNGDIIGNGSGPPLHVPLVRALVDHGAQASDADPDGRTPLLWAIEVANNATIRLLLAHHAHVNISPSEANKFTPLGLAAMDPGIETDVIAKMLDRGADVNQRDYHGETALLYAVGSRQVDVVRLLLARHADVTIGGRGNQTPLALALEGRSPQGRQIVCLLKAAGAKQ